MLKTIVTEITDTETVEELTEEQVETFKEVLGFEETEDVKIISEILEDEDNTVVKYIAT